CDPCWLWGGMHAAVVDCRPRRGAATGLCRAINQPEARARGTAAGVRGWGWSSSEEFAAMMQASGRPALVVVGTGMAGARVVEEVLARDPRRYSIRMFGAEPHG